MISILVASVAIKESEVGRSTGGSVGGTVGESVEGTVGGTMGRLVGAAKCIKTY